MVILELLILPRAAEVRGLNQVCDLVYVLLCSKIAALHPGLYTFTCQHLYSNVEREQASCFTEYGCSTTDK